MQAVVGRAAQAAQAAAGAAAAVAREEYRQTFEDWGCRILRVRERFLVVEFPSRGRQHWLANRLNRDHPGNYLVVNLSGKSCETPELTGPVLDVAMSGCVPPIEVLLRLCVSAHRWLEQSQDRVLVIHGDGDYSLGSAATSLSNPTGLGAVVLLLACYLSWSGAVAHPPEGALEACAALEVDDREALQPSQRRYLGYFEVLQRGGLCLAGAGAVRLARVVLVQVPAAAAGQRALLEVWQQERLLFRCERAGGDAEPLHVGVVCRGDVSVRLALEPAAADGGAGTAAGRPRPPWLQACFHTAFAAAAGGCLRFPLRQLDAAGALLDGGAALGEDCAVDVLFEEVTEAAAAAAAGAAADGQEPAAALAAARAAAAGPARRAPAALAPAEPRGAVGYSRTEAPPSAPPTAGRGARPVFLPEDVDAIFGDL